jgi:3-hydroxyacyl-[acyl-carrier-protein] dehydratase
MPPPLLFDVSKVDLSQIRLSQEQIYGYLPHRFEFMLLDGVCHWDAEAKQIVAFRDIKPDDWWARGHVPGRPLLPGVLMLEMSAQTSALLVKLSGGHGDFIAFGGVDHCKFREAVVAPARLYLLAVGIDFRSRRIVSDTQGVVNGNLVFEARITGLRLQ